MQHELFIPGTPASLQAKGERRKRWKERVASTARAAVPEDELIVGTSVSVVLVHFAFDYEGDLDNIAKPVLDGLTGPVLGNDRIVSQLTLRRTDMGVDFVEIEDAPSFLREALEAAVAGKEDVLYVKITAAPDHRRLP